MDDSADLGPLPESDDNSVLQAESFKALENALPADRFVLHPEPPPDAGVDWCVELRIGGRYTGMKAHIQVKATGDPKYNTDGSVSYSADVSNINYLLSGSSPLYVVYLAEERELRYAWVRDEVKRIQKENPDWKGQKTVTLRFTRFAGRSGSPGRPRPHLSGGEVRPRDPRPPQPGRGHREDDPRQPEGVKGHGPRRDQGTAPSGRNDPGLLGTGGRCLGGDRQVELRRQEATPAPPDSGVR